MLFAHAPTGYIISHLLFNTAWRLFSFKKKICLTVVLIFFAILPDFDLFYYYFIDATENHRHFLSHTPLLYLLLFVLLVIVGHLKSNRFIQWVGGALLLGSIVGHLFMDSLNSGVPWLAPWNETLFGFLENSPTGLSLFGLSAQFFVFFLEILITAGAALLFVSRFINKNIVRDCCAGLTLFLTGGMLFLLFSSRPTLYPHPVGLYLLDNDKDGTPNPRDNDMDNDGKVNAEDLDIDEDGRENKEDFILAVKQFQKIRYDTLRGKYLNIPEHFGMIIDTDVLRYSLAYAGFFVEDAMFQDWKHSATSYQQQNPNNTPRENTTFYDTTNNYFIFFKNNGLLINMDSTGGMIDPTLYIANTKASSAMLQAGDIIFFSDPVQHLGILIEDTPTLLFLDVSQDFTFSRALPLGEALERHGAITGVARVF